MATPPVPRELAAFRHRKGVRPQSIPKKRIGKRLRLLAKDPRPKAIEEMLSILSIIKTSSPSKLLAAVAGEDERFESFFDPCLTFSEQSHYLRTKHFSDLASLGLVYHEGKSALLEATHSFSLGSANGFLLEDQGALGGFSGSTFRDRILVTNLSEQIMQHELQHAFDSCIGLKSQDEGLGEYRAELASLAFSESETGAILRSFISKASRQGSRGSVYANAAAMIISGLEKRLGLSREKLLDLSGDAAFLHKVREVSLALLDRDYSGRTGLSYTSLVNTASN
ncbi:hypothetical protein GF412_04955 [Candidatus Micrarchaeota archaeon]|nr:hypothetical protein [Candidatus Micrarchaeota archaeon]MBD3418302.1 hypothetical protein [Candidatus Micrarchaeota archaeon]